jgi:hypothetical protein
MAMTRLPNATLIYIIRDKGMVSCECSFSAPPELRLTERGNYTVRLTKNAAACARREMWSF